MGMFRLGAHGALLFAHRFPGQCEPVCVVNQAVQDRVGQSWITDDFMMPPFSIEWYVELDSSELGFSQ